MRFREQPAVEEHAGGESQPTFVMAGEQFLGDAVAVVVGQHVQRLVDSQAAEQRLLQVGLFQQAVAMPARLGRVAEAEHVAGQYAVAPRQRFPEVVPVPGGAGEAVDQQQRLALPGLPVADREALEVQAAALRAPGLQGDARQRRAHWR